MADETIKVFTKDKGDCRARSPNGRWTCSRHIEDHFGKYHVATMSDPKHEGCKYLLGMWPMNVNDETSESEDQSADQFEIEPPVARSWANTEEE